MLSEWKRANLASGNTRLLQPESISVGVESPPASLLALSSYARDPWPVQWILSLTKELLDYGPHRLSHPMALSASRLKTDACDTRVEGDVAYVRMMVEDQATLLATSTGCQQHLT